jgi:malto-oligosyltrehalose trehalohydrolase
MMSTRADSVVAASSVPTREAFGAHWQSDRQVRFGLWAPACAAIRVELFGPSADGTQLIEMSRAEDGYHTAFLADIDPGQLYRFVLPDGTRIPDPASRFQPHDVHGFSEVIDSAAYPWQDGAWRGRPWHEAVIYELHIGTFTGPGTFRAAIAHLDHLVALGITAIEIMPVADFPGARNWGYDGVMLYAPDSTYGRPEDFKALIDAAHQRGLMVILDVVYNHFGPDGNYLPAYAPAFFTDRHQTPWGAAINYDGPYSRPVREFVIQNAIYWVQEFHLDGLRLDAVHAIIDDSPVHLLRELSQRVRACVSWPVHLILENEENAATLLTRSGTGSPLTCTAQWNDDVHHVLHVAATGEAQGYYADYLGDFHKLARALAEGFAFQGETMPYSGKPRGEPSAALPPLAFIAFIQNHDQIGNRAFGDRLQEVAPRAALRALTALYLLLPQVPMLFMGEEWGAEQPFPFFCDFDGELAEAVRQGRRQEFAKFPEFQDEAVRATIPDPQAEATFLSAKLDWNDLDQGFHAEVFARYQRLLAVRHAHILPLLTEIRSAGRYTVLGAGVVLINWIAGKVNLVLTANLSDTPFLGIPQVGGEVIWQEGEPTGTGCAPAWFVRWSVTLAT